ncbi:MAG: hypothetical protein V7638_3808 [Acidobacteriota bacterium]|jgi:hypothetical protein
MANQPFLLGPGTGTLRNNFSGWVGCKFVPHTPLTVTQLGRLWVTGNTGTRTVEILRVADLAVIATASINLASGVNDTFNYTAITPVTLQSGVEYYLVSQETNGSINWRSDDAALPDQEAFTTILSSASSANKVAWTLNTVSRTFVPCNFTYDDTAYSPTAQFNHWAEKVNVTVNDSTGGIKNTGGGGAGFDASARVEQMYDGDAQICEFTINTTTAMAFGIYAHSTTYTPGSVTVASLLAGWEINGGNGLVKESGTTRFTQSTVGVGDKFKIVLTGSGALRYYYKAAAGSYTLVFTSAITLATVQGWRPWRVIATFSASNAELTPCTITGNPSEYYDPDVAANRVVYMEELDVIEITAAAVSYEVQVPDSSANSGSGGVPVHAFIG